MLHLLSKTSEDCVQRFNKYRNEDRSIILKLCFPFILGSPKPQRNLSTGMPFRMTGEFHMMRQ